MRSQLPLRLLAVAGFLAASAVAPSVAHAAPNPDIAGRGQDVSWPQCVTKTSPQTKPLPADAQFGIVGTQNGTPNSANPCLAAQWAWASSLPTPPAFYLLSGNPGPDPADGTGLSAAEHDRWKTGSLADPTQAPRPCTPGVTDDNCAYDYGWQAAINALANVDAAGIAATPVAWWMDVEPKTFYRSKNPAQNVIALQGTRDALRTRPDRVASVGIYAAPIGNWKAITNGDSVTFADLPYWYPVGDDGLAAAVAHCGEVSPAGGPVSQVQWVDKDEAIGKDFDQDIRCLSFSYVPTVVRSGTSFRITGRAVPGIPLGIYQGEVNVAERLTQSVVAGADGSWSAVLSQRTNGYVTVRSPNSIIYRRIAATSVVEITRIAGAGLTGAGLCRVRLDGGVNPWLPGQIVKIMDGKKQVGYAHTRKRKDGRGSFSVILNVLCGKPIKVSPMLPGKAGKVTFAKNTTGPQKVLRPRR